MLVNGLASNFGNVKYWVAWLIRQEKNLKCVGELDKETYIPIKINLEC